MSTDILPDPATAFGERVRHRLRDERVIWFTTVGNDGTPQPNPVWFLWDDPGHGTPDSAASILIYNRADARRLDHIRIYPNVALHFDGNGRGGDIVVLTGRARVLDEQPPQDVPAYVEKYRADMIRVSGSLDAFGSAYPVPVRVELTRVRGF